MRDIDPQRLDLAAYPLTREITARVSDLDGHGHINAIRIGLFYEDARAAVYTQLPRDIERPRNVVVQLSIRYLGEGEWSSALTVGTGIAKIGTSSFSMAQALFQNGRCIGLCDTVIVNARGGKATPLPAAYRGQLERWLLPAG